jgi:plasmid stabilization system protein ParE
LQNGSRAGYAASAMTWLARLYKWGGPGLRSHPHGNYVIFFHYVGEAFEVVNVLEGHRDVAAFFGSDER